MGDLAEIRVESERLSRDEELKNRKLETQKQHSVK